MNLGLAKIRESIALLTDYIRNLAIVIAKKIKDDPLKSAEILISLLTLIAAVYIGTRQNEINQSLLNLNERQVRSDEMLASLQVNTTLRPLLQASYNEAERKITLVNHGKLPVWIDAVGLEESTSTMNFSGITNRILTGNQAKRIIAPEQSISIDLNEMVMIGNEFFQEQFKKEGYAPFIYQIFFNVDSRASGMMYFGRLFFTATKDEQNIAGMRMKINMIPVEMAVWPLQNIQSLKELYQQFSQSH